MKYLNYIVCAFLVSLLSWGCGDDGPIDDNGNGTKKSYARFQQSQLSVSGVAEGVSVVTVEWSQTEWEITYESGNIVKDVSQTLGGNSTDANQTTRVRVTHNANQSLANRSQTITLKNKTTGDVSELLIEQTGSIEFVSLNVDKSVKYQYIQGFGGMYSPKNWVVKIKEEEIINMFSEDRLGYNILRLMIYPNESDWDYDVEGAKKAQELGATIFACPWHIPAEMSEKVTIEGKEYPRHLKPESYSDFADHLVKYINYMTDNGINLYAISVQNEPDMEFTYWTPAEVADFVKAHGQQIRDTGVKLMAPEACGFHKDWTDAIVNDPQTLAQTDIVAGHLYQGILQWETNNSHKVKYEYLLNLKSRIGPREWWMTEHLFNEGEAEEDESKWEFRKWPYKMSTLAKEIHMCMDADCSAYVYWYMKRFYGLIADTDRRSKAAEGEVLKNGYILSHYAKYATGKTRVKVDLDQSGLFATAYINEAGNEVTLVLLNFSDEQLNVSIPMSGIKEIEAIETTENVNMRQVTTGSLGDAAEGAYVSISGSSITSIRISL